MKFNEIFNGYLKQIGCSPKEFSDISGISQAVVSRYRSGQRTPSWKSDSFQRVVDGLCRAASKKGIRLDAEEISENLKNAAHSEENVRSLAENLNTLIALLDIKASDLARSIHYEPSQLSRIRRMQRRPANSSEFAEKVASYIVSHYHTAEQIERIRSVTGKEGTLKNSIVKWLLCSDPESTDSVADFLTYVDGFNLDEYIESIHFHDIRIPSIPFSLPTSKTYYGTERMRQGELDFFMATILSRSGEDVFMHNDLPMVQRAEDVNWGKKWMMAIAAMLKKGFHLNMIHEVNRPFDEIMLGLELWIPIYMTGQISPYYLADAGVEVFHHLNYVSGSVALVGECIGNKHSHGRYYLTKKYKEVNYYKTKAADFLSYANPLMDIYHEDKAECLRDFLEQDAAKTGSRQIINSSLPLHTISDELLQRIALHNALSQEDIEKLYDYTNMERANTAAILKENCITEEISVLMEETFLENPPCLSASGAFLDRMIPYSYGEYKEHLQQTLTFAEAHSNYTIKQKQTRSFKNIKIVIHEGKWAMISKDRTPTIHFIIHHPKLVHAIEHYTAPISDYKDPKEDGRL